MAKNQTKATAKYNAKAYERITIRVKKGIDINRLEFWWD